MKLHSLPGTRDRKKTRRGRGESSGLGKTSGRGNKGARSRSGYHVSPVTSGIPWYRKLPIRGFTRPGMVIRRMAHVTLELIAPFVDGEGLCVDASFLRSKGLLKARDKKFKIIGNEKLSHPAEFVADAFSAGATLAIQESGGKVLTTGDAAEIMEPKEVLLP